MRAAALVVLLACAALALTTPAEATKPARELGSTACSGYTFIMNQFLYGQAYYTVPGTSNAATACSGTSYCQSFDTNYAGSSGLRTSAQYGSNSGTGVFIKTCDATTSGYAAITSWNWGGAAVSQLAKTKCSTAACCKSSCDRTAACSIFVFNSATKVCSWQQKVKSMTAGAAAPKGTTSWMKVAALV